MIRVAVLTISDGVAAGAREDSAGQTVREWVARQSWALVERRVVADETVAIAETLCRWADGDAVDLILTLGGTGLGPRDVTPEATSSVLQRPAPGICEALRAAGAKSTPFAMLSRGLAGSRGRALIVNLPGSERAVREGLQVIEGIVPHAVDLLHGKTEHL